MSRLYEEVHTVIFQPLVLGEHYEVLDLNMYFDKIMTEKKENLFVNDTHEKDSKKYVVHTRSLWNNFYTFRRTCKPCDNLKLVKSDSGIKFVLVD